MALPQDPADKGGNPVVARDHEIMLADGVTFDTPSEGCRRGAASASLKVLVSAVFGIHSEANSRIS